MRNANFLRLIFVLRLDELIMPAKNCMQKAVIIFIILNESNEKDSCDKVKK